MSHRQSTLPSTSSHGSSSASQQANATALQRISARDLTESQIRLSNASQCLQLTDQLDQELLSLMQELDGHFLRATRTVTDVLLPSVEKYGENSRDIWDAVKYFKTFFEVAAGIRLTDPTAAETGEEFTSDTTQAVFDSSQVSDSSTQLEGNTSAANAAFPAEASGTLEQLAKDAEQQFGISIGEPGTPKAEGKRQRMRDLSFDSPDNTLSTLDRPELETMSLGVGQAKLKGGDSPPDSPTASATKGKQTQRPPARTSTPARPKAKQAPDIPANWSAARPTDLSKTPLTGSSLRSYGDGNISDVASPPSMSYPFSHLPSQIARTPGKQAAEWMTRDIYETAALQLGQHGLEDSPVVEPPSVIKNWDKRNYGSVKKPAQPDFGRIVDDEDQLPQERGEHGDVSFGSVGDAPIEDWDSHAVDDTQELSEQTDDSHILEDGSFAREEAPDTLFGGKRDAGQLDRLSGFLKGDQNMHTLHGGQLLESQPFEASPLKGRDVRHGL